MEKKFYQDLKLGVIGGGQLGRMLIQSAINLNVQVHILDPDDEAPCKYIAHQFTKGSLTDYETVYSFGKDLDCITIEIENINLEALFQLEKEGKKIYPQPAAIKIIQDKRVQKQFYLDHQIPTAAFQLIDHKDQLRNLSHLFPAVLKLGKAGYDGRGVMKINTINDIEKAFDAPSLLEERIDFEKEISVIVSRNASGEMNFFPIVEMVFDPVYNLVDYLFAPARIEPSTELQAKSIAQKIIESLQMVGILAVEMFITKDGKILVNEIAPRPHNSGHHTIEANQTSQFDQHLRAILNLPLGSTDTVRMAAMVNLLGAEGYNGIAQYTGIEKLLSIEGVYPHLYGKKFTKPSRKMGHVSITAFDYETLFKKIELVKSSIQVIA